MTMLNGNTGGGGTQDFYDFMLAEQPQWAYFSSAPFSGGPGPQTAQQQYHSGQFGNVYNQYLGDLGSAAREGRQGTSFEAFLEKYPFTQSYYQNVSPTQRMGSSTRFAPSTRFMYR